MSTTWKLLSNLVSRQEEEEAPEEEVADVAEDVIEVDDVEDGNGAEEVVVAHVRITGLQKFFLIVQHLVIENNYIGYSSMLCKQEVA